MPKTRQEKIASYDEQISQLLIRKKAAAQAKIISLLP